MPPPPSRLSLLATSLATGKPPTPRTTAPFHRILTLASAGPVIDAGQAMAATMARSLGLGAQFRAGALAGAQLRRLLMALTIRAEQRFRAEARPMIEDEESITEWHGKAEEAVARRDMAAGIVAAGGQQPTEALLVALLAAINVQGGYLQRFRRELIAGVQPRDRTAIARAGLYGPAGWGVAQNAVRVAMASEGRQERRLTGSADVCNDCQTERNRGWQPAGSLRPIGDTVCRARCHCHFEYRTAAGRRIVAPYTATVFASRSGPSSVPPKPPEPPKPLVPKPPPSPPPTGPAFPAAKFSYGVKPGENQEKSMALARKMFGRDVTPEELARLAGAPADSRFITIRVGHKGQLMIGVMSPTMSMSRSIDPANQADPTFNRRARVLENSFFEARQKGTGIGTQVFSDQVQAAHRAGFQKIITTAVRDENFNGYYTWARLGYDAPIPLGIAAKLPASLSGARRVSELMMTAQGRDFWKVNGETIKMQFDLREGSLSRRVLDAYVAERATRTPAGSSSPPS